MRFRLDLRDDREHADDFDVIVYAARLYDGSLMVTLGEGKVQHRCTDPQDLGRALWPLLHAAFDRAEKRNGR